MYGGLDIQGNNIVFVHGSIDPWHALGITKTKENLAPAIYIKGYLINTYFSNYVTFKNYFSGTAHCANMYPPSENDLPELKAAREMIGELLEIWLQK